MKIRIRTLNLLAFSCSFVFLSIRYPLAQNQFIRGSGTATDPFVITTPQHLSNLRLYTGPTHSDKHFVLQNDIDLGVAPWNEGQGWEPIGTMTTDLSYSAFEGKLDGNNKRIRNLLISKDSQFTGLFGYCRGEIKNLYLDSVKIDGVRYSGGLCGRLDSGLVDLCFVSGIVTGENYVGGLVGEVRRSSVIRNCSSSCTVEGDSYIGGLLGMNVTCFIEKCFSNGIVTGSFYYIGGLIGNSHSASISNSYSTSTVSGYSKVGGFIGENLSCTIDSCYASGTVSGAGDGCGGFIGGNYQGGKITNCYSTSSVQGDSINSGGFAGVNGASIEFCRSSGNVIGETNTGGFAGYNSEIIERCYSICSVNGNNITGGFIGITYGEIQACFSTGNVEGVKKAGGFAGVVYDSISNSYSTGDVNASIDESAGFIAGGCTPAKMCYSTGKTTSAGPKINGFVIDLCSNGALSCYYDSLTSKRYDSIPGNPLGTHQMTARNSFVGWDFDSIWTINEGTTYPYFRWQGEPGEFNLIPGGTNNRKDLVRNSGNENGILFRGNEIILPYGNCTVKLFLINGTLISSFTASKPGAYDPFRGKRLSNGAYLVSVSGAGRESLRKVMIKK